MYPKKTHKEKLYTTYYYSSLGMKKLLKYNIK